MCYLILGYSSSKHSHLVAYDSQSGSKDRGDSLVRPYQYRTWRLSLIRCQTTNVFVSNLPPHVTVPTLGNLFAKAGSVGSVRLLTQSLAKRTWPYIYCLLRSK